MIVPTLRHQGTTPKNRSIDDAIFVLRSERLRSFVVFPQQNNQRRPSRTHCIREGHLPVCTGEGWDLRPEGPVLGCGP